MLVALQDWCLLLVEGCAPEIAVVVGSRVLHDVYVCGVSGGIIVLDKGQEILIAGERTLLLVGQTIEACILLLACTRLCREGVCHSGLCRNLAPLGRRVRLTAVDRHSALIEFLSVEEYVLADITKVDIHIAAHVSDVVIGVLALDEGVEHPELDILNIGSLKV